MVLKSNCQGKDYNECIKLEECIYTKGKERKYCRKNTRKKGKSGKQTQRRYSYSRNTPTFRKGRKQYKSYSPKYRFNYA